MKVNLRITTSSDYFKALGLEIDWEETGAEGLVSLSEAEAIQKIITCEVSVWLLRRAYGIDGTLYEDMARTRRHFIERFESEFSKKYISLQDFY